MRFFLDNCVPISVADVLREAGHEVIIQKDAIPPDSPDLLVALVSVENDAILVTFDKDFNSLASRHAIGNARLRKLSKILLRCTEPKAADRVKTSLSFIQAEWQIAKASRDGRMFIEIQGNALKTIR